MSDSRNLIQSIIKYNVEIVQLVKIPPYLELILFTFGLLQSTTFLITPNYEKEISLNEYPLYYIIYLCRLDVAINQLFGSSFNYLVSIFMITLFELLPIILYILKYYISNLEDIVDYLVYYNQMVSIYSQLYLSYLYIPQSMLLLNDLIYQTNQEVTSGSAIIIVIQVIFLVITFCQIIFKLILFIETIDLNLSIYQQLNLTLLEFLKYLLHILQFIVYGLFNDYQTVGLFQAIMMILIQLIQITQIFSLQTSHKNAIELTLLSSSFGLIYGGIQCLEILEINSLFTYDQELILLLTPFVYFIFLTNFKHYEDEIIQNLIKFNSISSIKYYFAKYFSISNSNNSQFIIFYSKYLNRFQYKNQEISFDIEYSLCQLQQVINKKYLDKVHKFLLKSYRKKVKGQVKTNQISNILHYLSILNRLGFNNLAFQQASQLLHRLKNLDKSQSRLNANSQGQTFDQNIKRSRYSDHYYLDKSQSKSSKQSKSQDVNEFQQQQLIENNKFIIEQNSILNPIDIVKLGLLNQRVHYQMKSQLNYLNNQNQAQNLKLGVSIFLGGEKKNDKLRQSILNFANKKLSFYTILQNQKGLKPRILFIKARRLCYLMEELEQRILKLYEEYPSSKIQSAACFFQAEILNNILEAYKFKNNMSLSDEKLQALRKNEYSGFNFFSKDMAYVSLKIDDISQCLEIVKQSESIYKLFNCTQEVFKQQRYIEEFIPLYIVREHQIVVQKFLQTGVSKFYLNGDRSFVRIDGCLMKPVKFFFDMQLNLSNQLQFYGFFQELEESSSFLAVDVNYQIGGITENFFSQIGYSIDNYQELQALDLTQIPISAILPEFHNIKTKHNQSLWTKINFIRKSVLIASRGSNNVVSMKTQTSSVNNWQSQSHLNSYDASIRVWIRELYGEQYILFEIMEVKSLQQGSIPQSEFIEDGNVEDSEEISQKEAIADNLNDFKIKQWNATQDDFEELNKIQNYGSQFYDCPKINVDPQSMPFDLMSPNQSLNPMNDNSKMPLQTRQEQFQQQYFSKAKDFSVSNIADNENNQSDAIDANNNVLKEIINQLGVDDQIIEVKKKRGQDSSKSSQAGIKKSIFYKKYEIQSLLLRPSFPNSLKLFIMFSLFQLVVGAIYCLVVLVEVTSDLNRFIEEIDMIQLHAGIMVPHDVCFTLRLTTVSYQAYIGLGLLSYDQYKLVVEPLYVNQFVGYEELQENFIIQFDNQYLQNFFNNRNFTVYFMSTTPNETYPIIMNIREALFQMYSYYYTFFKFFVKRLPPYGQTFQIFQFANFYKLHSWLEDLTLQIWQYSKARSETVISKWIVVFIVFLLISFCGLACSLYFVHIFSTKYDKFLNLFIYCTNENLQRDINRYKIMIKLLNNNTESIFHYRFELSLKEQFLATEKVVHSQDQRMNKLYKNKSQLTDPFTKLIRYCLIFLLWAAFLCISTASTQQTTGYLSNYSETTNLYKLIQDMSYSAGFLFLYRNIRLYWANFTFFDEFDFQQSYQLIYNGLNNIEDYQTFYAFFDPSKYQVSSDFVEYFDDISQKGLCNILTEQELGFLIQYCDYAFEGTLNKGLIPTLGYIRNSIENQMAINNFTERKTFQMFETEGGLIVVRAFQKMTKKLKQAMLDVTNSSQTISQNLSIIYLIYSFIFSLIVITVVKNFLKKEYAIIKRFIQLIPSSILFYEDQFERTIRILIAFQDN